MSPTRRKVLQTITTAIPVGTAGCLTSSTFQNTESSPSNSPRNTSTPTSTPPATPETTPPESSGRVPDAKQKTTYKRVKIGSRQGVEGDFKPHALIIWNTLNSEQSVSVQILNKIAESTVHRADYNIPSDEAVKIHLLTPSKYYVQLWGPPIGSPETLLVPCDRFDCNESSTIIGIFDDGKVGSTILSTLVACPGYDC